MLMALLLQSVAGPPVPRELRKPTPRVALPCPVTQAGEDIVVCARPTDQRLARLPEPIQPPRGDPLSFRLPGGGKGNVHAIRTELPGARGQGVAVTLKIPFGRGKRE
ncbi:hypothetical protein [Sphingomonas sp. M1A8_2b]